VRDIDGGKRSDLLLVHLEKFPACRELVIYDVYDLAVDMLDQTCKRDSIRAIIDIGKRYSVAASQMEKYAERADADSAR
jgi:hypothetical protein